jgi:hypothetical protein
MLGLWTLDLSEENEHFLPGPGGLPRRPENVPVKEPHRHFGYLWLFHSTRLLVLLVNLIPTVTVRR